MPVAPQILGHLLRRAGFGASPADLAAFGPLSYTQAVDRLIDYDLIPDDVDAQIGRAGFVGTTSNTAFSPNTVVNDARQRWLFRMLHSNRPLQEKMALFWHNYFATGFSKIQNAVGSTNATRLMAARPDQDPQGQRGQIELFREHAVGNMRDLLVAVAQDPAMLIWLDGNTNTKTRPQENFGRELMELFSRGVGSYTESDVYAAARVFTGWNLRSSLSDQTNPASAFTFVYRADQHETASKTFSFPIYPDGGTTIPARSAASGMQDGLDLIAALAMHPETARRLAGKLYEFFVSETIPNPGFVARLADVYRRSGGEIAPVLRTLFLSEEFTDSRVFYTTYSWPAEFVVRALKETGWVGFSLGSTLTPLINMNQQLFEPPDVAGWSLGPVWFSTGAMLARMNFASTLAANQKFKLAAAMSSARESSQTVVDLMLTRFTPSMNGRLSTELATYAGSGGAWIGSDAQLQAKTSGLAHIIVGSPEYQGV